MDIWNEWMDEWMDGWMIAWWINGLMDEWIDGWINKTKEGRKEGRNGWMWMNGLINGWMEGWMNEGMVWYGMEFIHQNKLKLILLVWNNNYNLYNVVKYKWMICNIEKKSK
jgi:hypothetical protein